MRPFGRLFCLRFEEVSAVWALPVLSAVVPIHSAIVAVLRRSHPFIQRSQKNIRRLLPFIQRNGFFDINTPSCYSFPNGGLSLTVYNYSTKKIICEDISIDYTEVI